MSVVVTMRVPGDTEQFRRFVAESGEKMRDIAERAKERGAIHHRFAIGEGFVLVIDEWESVERFQEFFQTPDIAEVMRESGAQGEPEFTFAEAISTSDQF